MARCFHRSPPTSDQKFSSPRSHSNSYATIQGSAYDGTLFKTDPSHLRRTDARLFARLAAIEASIGLQWPDDCSSKILGCCFLSHYGCNFMRYQAVSPALKCMPPHRSVERPDERYNTIKNVLFLGCSWDVLVYSTLLIRSLIHTEPAHCSDLKTLCWHQKVKGLVSQIGLFTA